MGRDRIAYTAYGYYVTGQMLRDRFGSLDQDGDWNYVTPWGASCVCAADFVNEVCVRLSAEMDKNVQYLQEGDYYVEDETDFGFVFHLSTLAASSELNGLLLEDLMRAEEGTCELGTRLTAMGITVESLPRVYSLLIVC